jgi:hypothetical protein
VKEAAQNLTINLNRVDVDITQPRHSHFRTRRRPLEVTRYVVPDCLGVARGGPTRALRVDDLGSSQCIGQLLGCGVEFLEQPAQNRTLSGDFFRPRLALGAGLVGFSFRAVARAV